MASISNETLAILDAKTTPMSESVRHLVEEYLDELYAGDITAGADKARSARAKRCKVKYRGLVFRNAKSKTVMLVFDSQDPMGTGRSHEVKVEIPEYEFETGKAYTDYVDSLSKALKGDIRVHCSCEDYLYKGFTYMSWRFNYGFVPELRFPRIRNPKLKGSACKHSLSALYKLNLFAVSIARDIASGKQTKFKVKTKVR